MISAWLGRTPPTHFAHALHRETEGNPFFIEEVLRHLIEVGVSRRPSGGAWLRSPNSASLTACEKRSSDASPRCRRQPAGIVTMAAAIGRSFSIEVLEALAKLRGERLLEALEDATERRIIEEEPGARGATHSPTR